MGVGMSLDLHLVFNHWILLLGIVFLLYWVKLVLFILLPELPVLTIENP